MVTGLIEAERTAPVVNYEQDLFMQTDQRIDKSPEMVAVRREPVAIRRYIGQLRGVAHPNQIRRDQATLRLELGHDIPPDIGGCRVAMQEQDRSAGATLMIRNLATERTDGLLLKRLFGHVQIFTKHRVRDYSPDFLHPGSLGSRSGAREFVVAKVSRNKQPVLQWRPVRATGINATLCGEYETIERLMVIDIVRGT